MDIIIRSPSHGALLLFKSAENGLRRDCGSNRERGNPAGFWDSAGAPGVNSDSIGWKSIR